MTPFRGQTENAGHFLQPTAKAIGHSVILDSSSVWPYAPLRDTRSPKLREKFPQSPFIHRAAAAPVSSGFVLKAMNAFGADLCTAFMSISKSNKLFGGMRIPPPITTQS